MEGDEAYLRFTFGANSPRKDEVVSLIITAAEADDLIGDAGTVTKKRGRKPAGANGAAAAPAAASGGRSRAGS